MIDVAAAIIRRHGKTLITQRRKDVHLPNLWEFPGGKVEPGETFEHALIREIREELGIGIAVMKKCATTEHHYATKSVRLHFFECIITSGEPQAIEVADLKWIAAFEFDDYEFPEADREIIAQLRKP